jgi:alpha-tubulin suppressor-like RCC1 family protein
MTSDGLTSSPTPCAPQPFPLHSLPDANAPKELKEQGIVDAAVGRGHTILVTDQGEAWTAGWNALGQVRFCLSSLFSLLAFPRLIGS